MEFLVSGQEDLVSFATRLRGADKLLSAEFNRGLRDIAEIVIKRIEESTDDYMPSGYEAVFKHGLQLKPEVRLVSSQRITIVGISRSRSKGRDVTALNEGRLRHPVHGRYRRAALRRATTKKINGLVTTIAAGSAYKNPWVLQVIRAGWFSEPFDAARPAAVQEMNASWNRVAKKINER